MPAVWCPFAERHPLPEADRQPLRRTSPKAAIFRNSWHIVSVWTTVVLVTATSSRVTASHAPSTLNRCRPDAARTKIRWKDQRQHKKVPKTK